MTRPGSDPTRRVVTLDGEIDDGHAQRAATALLSLAADQLRTEIDLHLRSTGGSVSAAMAIHDTMEFVDCDVATCAVGDTSGVAALLLAAGAPGRRRARPGVRLRLTPLRKDDGATVEPDHAISREIVEILAACTGQRAERVAADMAASTVFTAVEARRYGLVDRVEVGEFDPESAMITSALLPAGLEAARGYRNNPFRVLGLPVGADSRSVSRRRRELELAGELGTVAPAPEHRLPLDASPDAAAIGQAYAMWQAPRSRLMSELLWLWHQADGAPADEVESIHDLAVAAHCEVLDLEVPLIGRQAADPTRRQRTGELWEQAAVGWAEVLRDDRVWARLRRRVAEIDDPRLVPGDVTELRSGIPSWFLSINAALAWAAARAGTDGADHRAVMLHFTRCLGVRVDVVDKALRGAADHTVRAVEGACNEALTASREFAGNGCRHAYDLERQTAEPLAVLVRALGAEHTGTVAARDRVAETMRRCAARQFAWDPYSGPPDTNFDVLLRAHTLATHETSLRIAQDVSAITTLLYGHIGSVSRSAPPQPYGSVLPAVLIVLGLVVPVMTAAWINVQTPSAAGPAILLIAAVVSVVIVGWVVRRFR